MMNFENTLHPMNHLHEHSYSLRVNDPAFSKARRTIKMYGTPLNDRFDIGRREFIADDNLDY